MEPVLTGTQLLRSAVGAIKPPASIFKLESKLTYNGATQLTVELVDTFKLDINPSNPWIDRVMALSNNWQMEEGRIVIKSDSIIGSAVRGAARDLQSLALHFFSKTRKHPSRCNAFRRINAVLDNPMRGEGRHVERVCNWWCRLGMKKDTKNVADAPGANETLNAMLSYADQIKHDRR